jgi:hypothetical protein
MPWHGSSGGKRVSYRPSCLTEDKEHDSAMMNDPALTRMAHEMSQKALGGMSA